MMGEAAWCSGYFLGLSKETGEHATTTTSFPAQPHAICKT